MSIEEKIKRIIEMLPYASEYAIDQIFEFIEDDEG